MVAVVRVSAPLTSLRNTVRSIEMDFVLAADAEAAKTDKTSFPDFPGENPPQAEMLKWLDAWHDDLVTSGFSAHLRGELPFELAKLKPRELLPVPTDAAAAVSVTIQNSSITHTNEINATEIKERTIELDNRLARKIAKSMRKKAPIRLKKLLKDHQLKNTDGSVKDDCFKGADMWNELSRMRNRELSEYYVKKYARVSEKMRDTKLPDNIDPQSYATRLNTFLNNINPIPTP